MIDLSSLHEESLKADEMRARYEAHEPFYGRQMWGLPLGPQGYLVGSSALLNDDNEDRPLAVINWTGEVFPLRFTTYLDSIREVFGLPQPEEAPKVRAREVNPQIEKPIAKGDLLRVSDLVKFAEEQRLALENVVLTYGECGSHTLIVNEMSNARYQGNLAAGLEDGPQPYETPWISPDEVG